MTPRICFRYDVKHSANRNKQKYLIILQLYAQRLVVPYCYRKVKRNSIAQGQIGFVWVFCKVKPQGRRLIGFGFLLPL